MSELKLERILTKVYQLTEAIPMGLFGRIAYSYEV